MSEVSLNLKPRKYRLRTSASLPKFPTTLLCIRALAWLVVSNDNDDDDNDGDDDDNNNNNNNNNRIVLLLDIISPEWSSGLGWGRGVGVTIPGNARGGGGVGDVGTDLSVLCPVTTRTKKAADGSAGSPD